MVGVWLMSPDQLPASQQANPHPRLISRTPWCPGSRLLLFPAPVVAQLMLPADLPADSLTTHKSSTIQAQWAAVPLLHPRQSVPPGFLDGRVMAKTLAGPLAPLLPPAVRQQMAGQQPGAERAQSSASHIRWPSRAQGLLHQQWEHCIPLFLMELFSTKVSERKGTISLPLPALFIISDITNSLLMLCMSMLVCALHGHTQKDTPCFAGACLPVRA